ncbi:hypothetical protein CVS30_16030 [Arthrobacter psychrolactophilus]|uniref:Polysaccharide chain length determinant N-terminal domain-containing protein n=1 Tax=Arthrobacter psychrolactophilus TaxID=92442 RepID=A0A2V5IPJ6_9MICC|nr:hypothetical protein CVS30_16030 [Arthrobacter psychrolactophilus]
MSQKELLPTVKLSDLAKIIAHRWLVIVVTLACCVSIAAFLGMAAPKTYTATASLTVSPITTNPFSSAAVNQQINITTERAILASGEVAALAAKDLGEKVTPGTLQSNSETAAPSGSQVLQVSVTLPDGQKAADQANALAKAYLQFRSEGAAEVAAGYIEQLDARIKTLTDQSVLSDGQLQQLQDLMQQRTSLILASATPGRIIGYATSSSGQSSMSILVFLAAGTMGGLLLGMGLALLRERTDPLVRRTARQGAFFDSELVRLNDDDQESVRWLVRNVRGLGSRQPRQHTTFVGIISLPGGGPAGLAWWLAELTQAHKLNVATVVAHDISQESIDLGWPARSNPEQWIQHDVVYVEIDNKLTGTRLADLAERMDMLFVISGKSTRLKHLRATMTLIAGMPQERIKPIYYVPSRKKKTSRRKSRKPHIPVRYVPPESRLDGRANQKNLEPGHELDSSAPREAPRGVLVPQRLKKGN